MLTRKMLLAAIVSVAAIAIPLAGMQSGRKIYKQADGATPPSVIEKVEPNYTPEAKEAGVQGTVKLSGVIETNGRMSEVTVLEGIDEGLDRNAVEAVHQWVFKPGEKDGTPVPFGVTIVINFALAK